MKRLRFATSAIGSDSFVPPRYCVRSTRKPSTSKPMKRIDLHGIEAFAKTL